MNWRATALAMLGAIAVVGGVVLVARTPRGGAPCGAGFTRSGTRCCPTRSVQTAPVGGCLPEPGATCPPPLVPTPSGCDAAEHDVVEVPATTVVVGPADWEAEGRVTPRTAWVEPFAIDRLEVSTGRFCASFATHRACSGKDKDAARAAHSVSFQQARDFCSARGGRLPTDDEWLAAAGGERPRRYAWGDTGAVCRRAAWGLESGPCGEGAGGPDTVGAHPEGMTPLGIHDLAGNVAEWVDVPCTDPEPNRPCRRFVRGGSWRTTLATELRTWLRSEIPRSEDPGPEIGFRCAYDRARP